MLQTARILLAAACCGAFVFATPVFADVVGAGKGAAEKSDPNKKAEKADGDKADKGKGAKAEGGVKPGGEKPGGEKAGAAAEKGAEKSAEKGQVGKKPEQQAPQQRAPEVRSRQFNEKDYTRLKMGPNGPLPVDKAKSNEAREALEAAKADLTKALGGVSGNTTAQAENQLWRDDGYRNAALELRRAHADYDDVRRPIFAMLREDSYYRELEKKQTDSQRVIQSLVLTGRSSFDYLFPHAMAALEMRKRMTRAEIIALAQAPEVEDARQRMLIAAAKVRSIRANHLGQFNDPQLIKKAKEDLDLARDRVKQAQADLAAAQQDEAEYEKIRLNYIEEWRRTGTQPPIN